MAISTTRACWSIGHPLKPDFSNLSLSTRPTPTPSGTQCLIRIKAVSLNARDCQIANGSYPAPIQVQAGVVGASDAAGDVVAIGPAASRFRRGDRLRHPPPHPLRVGEPLPGIRIAVNRNR
jgi:D-arabinose 1-dehydrogenase-like Zn-dependent alcohol dehydrogenase